MVNFDKGAGIRARAQLWLVKELAKAWRFSHNRYKRLQSTFFFGQKTRNIKTSTKTAKAGWKSMDTLWSSDNSKTPPASGLFSPRAELPPRSCQLQVPNTAVPVAVELHMSHWNAVLHRLISVPRLHSSTLQGP